MRLQALRTPLAADPQRPPATAKDATSGRGKWSLLRCPECRLNLVSVDAVKIHFSSHHLPPPLLPNYFHPRPAGQLLPHLLRLSIASRDCSRRSAVRPASSCGKGRQSAREKKSEGRRERVSYQPALTASSCSQLPCSMGCRGGAAITRPDACLLVLHPAHQRRNPSPPPCWRCTFRRPRDIIAS